MAGKFGFYLGANTQVQIDYIYISALKEYNGVNKLFNLSEEDAQKLIEEQESIKNQLKEEKENAINELEEVIQILENQLKYSNQIVDSLRKEIDKYEPFKDLIKENGNFMHTLTKDLKLQLEKNNILKNTNKTLSDSIESLIEKQEEFKLEYLRVFVSKILDYRERYGTHPSAEAVITILRTELDNEEDVLKNVMLSPPNIFEAP